MAIERESIEFDVLFVGGRSSSLAGAIHFIELVHDRFLEFEIAVVTGTRFRCRFPKNNGSII